MSHAFSIVHSVHSVTINTICLLDSSELNSEHDKKKNSYYLGFNNTKHFTIILFLFFPNSIINFKVSNPNIFQPFKILQHKNNRKWIRLIILAFMIFNVGIVEPSSAPHNFISPCVFVIMKLSGVNFYKTRESCKKQNVIYMEKSINMNNIYSINTILMAWKSNFYLKKTF